MSLDLSLRQKKLLHTVQHSGSPRTSFDLADELGVSSRTIRNDIIKINEELLPHRACIEALKGKGYQFHADDPKLIESLNQIETAFFSKENRVRYLAFQLCLSEEPLNVYDLEDEMFISHTTLEHAIRDLTRAYSHRPPHIRLIRKRDHISLEEDELKRRAVLNLLLRESWNYHARGNAYYQHDFIDNDILDFIIDTVSVILDRHGIQMEDPFIVSLNLILAIMHYRIETGHPLTEGRDPSFCCDASSQAATEILDAMEEHLHCSINEAERQEIIIQIHSHRLLTPPDCSRQSLIRVYGAPALEITEEYIQQISRIFHLDLSDDDDFRATLCQFVQNLLQGHNTFNEQFSVDMVKRHHRLEMVIASLFLPLSEKYFDEELDEIKLVYLSFIIAGALDNFIKHHPGNKIRTVIACHMNQPVSWSIKRKARFHFGSYLDIVDIIPVYMKDSYDFSDVDLVLTTVQKQITANPRTTTIYISQFMDEVDQEEISHYIMTKTLKPMYQRDVSLNALLRSAWWHEEDHFSDPEELLRRVTQQFVDYGVADSAFQGDILKREKITTFAAFPGVVLLYSLVPAARSQISIVTLDHRITWNSHKIRIIVTAALTEEDLPAILRLTNFLYDDAYDAESIKNLKTREEILAYVQDSPLLLLQRDQPEN